MVGILPAEEIALKRALVASLINGCKKNGPGRPRRADNCKPEEEKVGDSNKNGGHHDKEEAKGVDSDPNRLSEGKGISLTAPLKRLASPSFSEDGSTSSNLGRTSCPPSSPFVSNRSSSSLHLFISPSSSPSSSCVTMSSDCPSSPWSPGRRDDNGKKKKSRGRKKARGKRTSGNDNCLECGGTVVKKRKIMLERGPEGEEDGRQAREDGRWKRSLSKEIDAHKEGFFQAQRKFATNHTPPVRCVIIVVVLRT